MGSLTSEETLDKAVPWSTVNLPAMKECAVYCSNTYGSHKNTDICIKRSISVIWIVKEDPHTTVNIRQEKL